MKHPKLRRFLIVAAILTVLFFVGYSYFFRTYLEPSNYLSIAWEYTGHDPHILNPEQPEAEVVWRNGKLLVHMTYYTDQDNQLGPYSIYIDPFKREVVFVDPRN